MEVETALGFLPGSHFVYCAEVEPSAQQDRGGDAHRYASPASRRCGTLERAISAWGAAASTCKCL